MSKSKEKKLNQPKLDASDLPNASNVNIIESVRNMKTYTITKDEMNNISHYNSQTSIFVSVASFFLSAFIALCIQYFFTSQPTQDQTKFSLILAITFLIIVGVSAWLAYKAHESKENSVDTIIYESVERNENEKKKNQ